MCLTFVVCMILKRKTNLDFNISNSDGRLTFTPIYIQQKTTNRIHESQHTLTLPLDSWLNQGCSFAILRDSESQLIIIHKWTESLQILALWWVLIIHSQSY